MKGRCEECGRPDGLGYDLAAANRRIAELEEQLAFARHQNDALIARSDRHVAIIAALERPAVERERALQSAKLVAEVKTELATRRRAWARRWKALARELRREVRSEAKDKRWWREKYQAAEAIADRWEAGARDARLARAETECTELRRHMEDWRRRADDYKLQVEELRNGLGEAEALLKEAADWINGAADCVPDLDEDDAAQMHEFVSRIDAYFAEKEGT